MLELQLGRRNSEFSQASTIISGDMPNGRPFPERQLPVQLEQTTRTVPSAKRLPSLLRIEHGIPPVNLRKQDA
jgi:hypothetical protein